MSHIELVSFYSPEELARAAARDWLDQIQKAGNKPGPYLVALSGGRIAGEFLRAAADLAEAQRDLFDRVHFFWSDERCVPPDNNESNFLLAEQRLLLPLAVPEQQVHRIRGEESPEAAAAEAEVELRQFASSGPGGQPILDLVFLGLGEEGHVASLFPGEPQSVMTSAAVFRPVVASKPPPHRITMGYPAIAAATEVWLLASGAGKATALEMSLRPDSSTPLGRVLQSRKQARIFSDISG